MDRQVRGTSWEKINVEFILQALRSREEKKTSFSFLSSKIRAKISGKKSISQKEYVGHLTMMGSANFKIANSNIFLQNVGKTTLKPIADHTQLLEPQGPLLLLKQQNNSYIVTPIIHDVLQIYY